MRSSAFTTTGPGSTDSVGTLDEPAFTSTAASKSEPMKRSFAESSSMPMRASENRRPPVAKRGLDVALSGFGLLVALPLAAVIAAAVKLGDGGPVFFTQERVGKDGKPFKGFKFRSMVPDADRLSGTVQASEQDPRITPIGRLLRGTAMDELPQLWNIFRGDMSFVGPRALASSEVEVGASGAPVALSSIPGFAMRHSVTPGLTGIAQVYAARDLPRRQKFRYDRLYVDNQSFWLDIKLIVLSFWITFRGKWEAREKKL
jgi:lipopolysaccharide/colanic/teichoic acid biosynthesis glycosyltransferase